LDLHRIVERGGHEVACCINYSITDAEASGMLKRQDVPRWEHIKNVP